MNDATLAYHARLTLAAIDAVDPMPLLCRVTAWIFDGDIPPPVDVVVAAVAIRAHEWATAQQRRDDVLARSALRDLQRITDAMAFVYG